jgi:hypothetical protein
VRVVDGEGGMERKSVSHNPVDFSLTLIIRAKSGEGDLKRDLRWR